MARHSRLLSLATAAAILTITGSPAAAEPAGPPTIDAGRTPAGSTGPEVPMRQDKQCATAGALGNVDLTKAPAALTALDVPTAWKFSRGDGVTVAVLGTGVEQHFRLPRLRGGGDFIDSGNGLTDCDAFGTLVAGVIAGSQSPNDDFSGIAPEASILSLRVTSQAYSPNASGRDPNDPDQSNDAIYARALARAIVSAADAGAGVIAIPQPACMQAREQFDQGILGAAVLYASRVKDSVIVAASGNTIGTCQQNPPYLAIANDLRNWSAVTTISTPSVFADHVLSVGMTTLEGLASDQSLQGPWVGIAAPGTGIVTTGNDGAGLVNAVQGQDQLQPIAGSAYSTAIVAGTAALVRARYPHLNAFEVMNRLKATAHHPPRGADNLVGYGTIDPVAALTHDEPSMPQYGTAGSAPVEARPAPPPEDHRPKTIAIAIVGASLLLAVAVPTGLLVARKQDTP